MMKIRVSGEFDYGSCNGCFARENCAGNTLASMFAEDINTDYVKTELNTVVALYGSIAQKDRQVTALHQLGVVKEHLQLLAKMAERAQSILTSVVKNAVEAQALPKLADSNADARSLRLDNVVALNRLELNPLVSPIFLDQVGSDVLRYAESGICGAIDVEIDS